MKLNKYLTILAGAALLFTACEEKIVREPSPETPEGVQAVYFPNADERGAEIDPSAGIYKTTVSIARKDSVGELTVALKVLVNTDSIFKLPESMSVTFADQQKLTTFEVSFNGAQDGKTYSLQIAVDESQVDPYSSGYATYDYSVTPIKWEVPEKDGKRIQAIVNDASFTGAYNVPGAMWYVDYEFAQLGGGKTRYRLINMFASIATDVDEWGIYNGFPYNDPGDYDEENDYYTILDVNEDGKVSMPIHDIGVAWSYGEFSVGATRDYLDDLGSANAANYNYGELDEDGVITWAVGDVYLYIIGYGPQPSAVEQFIYLDPQVYYDANSSVKLKDFEDGFNDKGIEWKEIEGGYERFVTKAFAENGDAWTQPLLNAVDPNADDETIGEASEFYNLYMLPDLYTEGYGFAFYFDSVKNSIKVPAQKQPTGITFAGKEMFVVPTPDAEHTIEFVNIKGTDVTVFHFFVDLVTKDDVTFGSYEELYYFSVDPINWYVEDFTGTYTATGSSLFQGGSPLNTTVAISETEIENVVAIEGLWQDPILASLDLSKGTMTIAPQMFSSIFHDEWEDEDDEGNPVTMSGDYAMMLLTYAGGASQTAAMVYNKPDEALELSDDSPAIGYLIYGVNVEDEEDAGYFDGYHHVTFTPSAESEAPAKIARHKTNNALMSIKTTAGKQISTSHLKAQGKISRHPRNTNKQVAL
ncbi:MAG: hypothetical protein IJS13_01100 [Paludibacteraceae bacterium]|nr:hypothetical protein [Paludibacteraceae bacterium]